MPLLDEVAQLQAEGAEQEKRYNAELRARRVEEAAEMFRKYFEEEPESVKHVGRYFDKGGSRRGETCYASALIEHEGVRLIFTHSQHAELRALIVCEHCGREFASSSTVYGYSNARDHDDPGIRARTLESLAKALNEHRGRYSDIYDHKCEESTMLRVSATLRDAAHTLNVSEWDVVRKWEETRP